jgi:hypothetical protein
LTHPGNGVAARLREVLVGEGGRTAEAWATVACGACLGQQVRSFSVPGRVSWRIR